MEQSRLSRSRIATHNVLVAARYPATSTFPAHGRREHIEYMTSKISMGRVSQLEEVAAVATFLSSDDLSFSTGAVCDLSGGRATY